MSEITAFLKQPRNAIWVVAQTSTTVIESFMSNLDMSDRSDAAIWQELNTLIEAINKASENIQAIVDES